MWIRDEIAAVVSRLGARAVELPASEVHALEQRIERAFAGAGTGPLWERVRESEGIIDPNAWKKIAAFVREPAILLVRDAQGICAFRFESSGDIVATLSSCSGFGFYVVDDGIGYMLAFNDHDVLIGCGAAAEWVRELRRSAGRDGSA